MIKIVADVDPVPFKRVMGGKRRYNDKRYSEYKDVLGYFALKAMAGREPLTGAIVMVVHVYRKIKLLSTNYGDADNHVKSVMDALSGICYKDDSQVVLPIPFKHYGEPKVIIELIQLPLELWLNILARYGDDTTAILTTVLKLKGDDLNEIYQN